MTQVVKLYQAKLCGVAQMGKERDLINAILERVQDSDGKRKLTCAEAFELAQEYETEIIEIGNICNRHNIRICECQLGCFS